MDNLEEQWLPIAGYEGSYEVSDAGRVRSVDRIDDQGHRVSGRMLRLAPNNSGRFRARLTQHGVQSRHFVHRLVAEAFIPNPDGLPLVLHWDDNPSRNRVENLRWGTYSDNKWDRIRNGNDYEVNKTHCIHGHEFTPENIYRRSDGGRDCRTCRARRSAAWRLKKQASKHSDINQRKESHA